MDDGTGAGTFRSGTRPRGGGSLPLACFDGYERCGGERHHGLGCAVKSDEYRPRVGYTSWLLKRTERSAATLLYDRLRDLGLTPSQYGVLQALIRLEKASSADLARALFVTPQA